MGDASTTLAIAGIIIIVITVGLLISNKVNPVVAMVTVPVVGALAIGYNITEVGEFFSAGAQQVLNVVIMFIFAITFFGILSDAGVFDPIIHRLILLTQANVIAVTIITGLLAAFANLDGSAATTFLITIPALLGLYKALNMSRYLMLLMIALGIGILNMLPWGGPLGRTASATGIPLMELYRPLIPLQGVALVFLVILGALLGYREKRRISKRIERGEIEQAVNVDVKTIAQDFLDRQKSKRDSENIALRSQRKWLYWANISLTIGILALMLTGLASPAFAFVIGVALALPLNFATSHTQMERIRAHAPNALMMGIVILGAAVFLGVLNKTGMLNSIAVSAIQILPEELGSNLHLIVGALGVPFDLIMSTDAYYFSLLPIVEATASQYGVSSLATSHALLIGNNIGTMTSPFAPALWLGLGLAGASLGKHLRYSFMIIWAFSLVVMLAAFFLGILSF